MGDLQSKGFSSEWTHAANSAAVLRWPGSWYDAVRPGLILYGVSPFDQEPTQLKPLLSLKTRLMHLMPTKKGTSVGYGCSYITCRNSVVAALPIGYADGYNRLLSNRGSVLLRGQRVPIVGRISMDLTVIDVTDVPTAQPGDEAVLIGRQGSEQIGASELAKLCHTIPYEILTGISQRVPRVFMNAQ
jgi:alanine racemase